MGERARAFPLRLAAIAALGVALRAVYLFVVADDVDGLGDWHFYHGQANLLADGRGFLDPFALLEQGRPPTSAGHPPLYPLALAGLSLLGLDSELAHRSGGLVFGAGTIVLAGLLARRVAGPRVGLLAAGLVAVHPLLIAADGALLSEGLYATVVAGLLLVAWELQERPRRATALALGALAGLAALTRGEAVLLLPLLALPVAWRAAPGDRAARLALVAAAAVLVLAPWTIRNWTTFDRPILLSTNEATVVAGANCPLTYSGPDLGGWNIECISRRRPGVDEGEQAAIWRREGLEYAEDHVSRLPLVLAVRVLRSWDLYQPRRQVTFAEGKHRRVQQAGIALYFLLLPLALAGAWLLRRRGVPLLVLVAPAAVVVAASVLGYGVTRFRHVAEVPIAILAAVALERVLMRWRARGA